MKYLLPIFFLLGCVTSSWAQISGWQAATLELADGQSREGEVLLTALAPASEEVSFRTARRTPAVTYGLDEFRSLTTGGRRFVSQ